MRLSIIIGAHNEGQALVKTVGSCVETCAGLDYEILLADDASWDGSVQEVERRFSRVRVLKNLERLGPSPTKDRGARAAAGDVLVFLDGHTKPERGALERLAEDVVFLGGRAIVAPTIVPLDVGRWRSAAAPKGHGYRVDLEHFRSTWLPLDKLRVVEKGPRKFYESPVAIGCALAVGRELYDTLWGFDSDMRYWGVEDVDFSLKCWLMGYSVLHDPEPVIGHRFQRSFSNYSVPAAHLIANEIRLARKNFTQTTFEEWVERRRKEHGEDLQDHPEGLWTHAWQLFESRRPSAEEERAYLLARRVRDEFWYAKRSGLDWPQLGALANPAAKPAAVAAPRAKQRPFAFVPSPSPTPGGHPKPDPTTGCHCVSDCPTCDAQGTTAPYPAPKTAPQHDTPHIDGTSGGPVQYGNGEIQLATTDLSVSGF
ncbi:MAG TPA: glycosyltransferase, partial [Pirellulales bacterium]|nr:glycosyltransferase [Pirellulales bacterium]